MTAPVQPEVARGFVISVSCGTSRAGRALQGSLRRSNHAPFAGSAQRRRAGETPTHRASLLFLSCAFFLCLSLLWVSIVDCQRLSCIGCIFQLNMARVAVLQAVDRWTRNLRGGLVTWAKGGSETSPNLSCQIRGFLLLSLSGLVAAVLNVRRGPGRTSQVVFEKEHGRAAGDRDADRQRIDRPHVLRGARSGRRHSVPNARARGLVAEGGRAAEQPHG